MSEHSRTFSCNCGDKVTVTLDGLGCFNVGEAMEKTGGWKYVPLYDGAQCWLCIKCKEKALRLAKELVEVVGNSSFPISWFVERKD